MEDKITVVCGRKTGVVTSYFGVCQQEKIVDRNTMRVSASRASFVQEHFDVCNY